MNPAAIIILMLYCEQPQRATTNIDDVRAFAALVFLSRLFFFFSTPSPSNLPFLNSLSLFPDYRVTVAAAPPERRERNGTRRPRRSRAPSKRGERVVRAEGARGARRPWRTRCRRAAGARGARWLRRPCRRRAEGAKRALFATHVACAAGVLPFPPPPAPAQRRDPRREAAT